MRDEQPRRGELLGVLERQERLRPESIRAPVPELPARPRGEHHARCVARRAAGSAGRGLGAVRERAMRLVAAFARRLTGRREQAIVEELLAERRRAWTIG